MPKFCTKCGSALINGKCPNCDSGQPMGQQDHKPNDSLNQQEHEPHTASTEHYKEQGKAFFQNLLMIIKNPVDGLLVAAEDKNSKIGLIFMGIEAVLAGLFVFIFFSKIQGMIETLSSLSSSDVSGNLISFSFLIVGCLLNMGENMETFGNMFTNTSELTKPFMGGYLIREAIVVFLTSLIVSGLVYVLMRYMAHAEMNWFQSCQLVGLRSLGQHADCREHGHVVGIHAYVGIGVRLALGRKIKSVAGCEVRKLGDDLIPFSVALKALALPPELGDGKTEMPIGQFVGRIYGLAGLESLLGRDAALDDIPVVRLVVGHEVGHELCGLLNQVEILVDDLLRRIRTVEKFGEIDEVRLLPYQEGAYVGRSLDS